MIAHDGHVKGTSLRLALGSLLVFAVAFAACSGGGESDDETSPVTPAADDATAKPAPSGEQLGVLDSRRPRIGEPAPDFALLDARDGSTVRRLSDYRGKAVVVNWYASWCGPCKAEIPEFQEAYAALEEQVVFLGVNFQENQERATGILDLFFAKYPAVLDRDGRVGEHYRVTGLPVTYFVDAEGVIRGIKIGRVTPKDLSENLEKVGVTYSAE